MALGGEVPNPRKTWATEMGPQSEMTFTVVGVLCDSNSRFPVTTRLEFIKRLGIVSMDDETPSINLDGVINITHII